MTRLQQVLDKIDETNARDPTIEIWQGKEYPKEVLYGIRMTDMLEKFAPEATECLQIAARGQHIKRWAISRDNYPMDRKGYLKWRTALKLMHGELLGGIMEGHGYSAEDITTVQTLVTKKKLKTDADSQLLEDVVCLVFLQFYFEEFIPKHEEEKVISILQKTWKKMTGKGRDAALSLPLSASSREFIQKALG